MGCGQWCCLQYLQRTCLSSHTGGGLAGRRRVPKVKRFLECGFPRRSLDLDVEANASLIRIRLRVTLCNRVGGNRLPI